MAGRRPTLTEVDEIVLDLGPAADWQFPVAEQTEHDHGEGSTSYPSLRKRKRTQAFVVSHLPSHIAEHSSSQSSSDTFANLAQKKISRARAQTFADAICSPTSRSVQRSPSSSNTLPLTLNATRKTTLVREPLFGLLDPDLSIPEDEVDKAATQSDSSHAHLLEEPVRKRKPSSKRASLAEAQEHRRKVSLHEKLKSVPVPIAERKALW